MSRSQLHAFALSRTDALNHVATYAYDALGRMTSTTDRASVRRDFDYDDANHRRTEKWYSTSNSLVETLTFTYDAAGNLTGAANSAGVYTIAYDPANRPDVVQGLFGLTLTFTYDAAGNRTRVEDSRGGVVSSSYDAANRLTRREQSTGGTVRLAFDYAYTDADEVLSVVRRDGSNTQVGRTTYAYDPAGRMTLVRHEDGSNAAFRTLTYSYDAASRLTATKDNGTTTSFEYDAADQLTKDGTRTFAYDPAGNSTINATYGVGNQIETASYKGSDYVYEYDLNGNRIQRESNIETGFAKYAFDHADRLTRFEWHALTDGEGEGDFKVTTRVDYTYDAFGNRVARGLRTDTGGGLTTVSYERFGIDMWEVTQDFWGSRLRPIGNEHANVWVDLDGLNSDALLQRRVYHPGWDQVAGRLDGSNVARFYLPDRQGSVVGAVNISGTPVATVTYEAFGRTLSGTPIDRYGYTGREFDATLGLYHYRDRAYDPAVGRFLQEDPIDFRAGDPNLYRYVGNSPTNATDPSGRFLCTVIGGIGGAIYGGGKDIVKNGFGWSNFSGAAKGGAIGAAAGLAADITIASGGTAAAAIVVAGAAGGTVGGAISGAETSGTAGIAAGAAKGLASGFVAGAVAAVTAGVGSFIGLGSGLVGAASAIAGGQAGRAADNLVDGRPWKDGLGSVGDIIQDGVFGGVGAKVGGRIAGRGKGTSVDGSIELPPGQPLTVNGPKPGSKFNRSPDANSRGPNVNGSVKPPKPTNGLGPTVNAPVATPFKPITPVQVSDAHSVNTITGKTRFGDGNRFTPKTVLKGDVDIAADIAEINAGRATRLPNGDIQTSSGRIYGTHPDKPSMFPRSGPGAVNLTQAEFDLYKKMIDSGGLTGDARRAFDGMMKAKNGGLSAESEQKLIDLLNSRKQT